MSEKRDYRDTVFLPKTDFPMKAGLPQKEPGILARWEEDGLYRQLREARAGREKFILHDGPPYANGNIHIGHALNKVLKDAVVRTQTLLGKDAPYVPGWDCHGLPIEWKIEEAYRKKKKNKDEVPPAEFRQECREYAAEWVAVQAAQFKRLGVMGEWDKPYLTMAPEAEAGIVAELLKFAENDMLYRGAKPVMWSPVEKTALAEAEVEYEDIVSTQIDVAFEIVESPIEELVGAHAVIWTTTPWTIPVNQALAFGPDVEYTLFMQSDGPLGSCSFLIATELLEEFKNRTGLGFEQSNFNPRTSQYKGSDLAGTKVRHPMHHLGGFFAEPRPMLAGDFVTTDAGTGIVHMAPDHGEDDFDLCKANGITPKFVVDDDGRYREDWGWLPRTDERNASVINPKFNAPDGPICSDLREAGALLSASADYQHSYPHSWRSKAKVIFRCTPQWFVPMDKPLGTFDYPVADAGPLGGAVALGTQGDNTATLRETAMSAIEHTRFVPAKGKNRIGSMVEGRPDWVLSRQRAWGVPITLFVHRESGEYLVDRAVNQRIIEAIRQDSVDAWNADNAAQLLGPDYKVEDYEMVTDILDVWFDSGSTHAFVLESDNWPDLQSPADLYLEGSDQHRGWFQSSLLESCATRGRAPYKQVLTHGFTMAADGRKMSKSLGNTIDPLKVMEEYGADIIRLWALSVDYTEDHRIGPEILKGVADQYRRLRNTFRYLLGALKDFDEDGDGDFPEVSDYPELERYVLTLLSDLDARLRKAIGDYDFDAYTRALVDFCNEDLSAFFFDIRKDSLYCDAPSDTRRQSYRGTLELLFHALVRYAAPVLVFTTEEVWQTRFPDAGSVHLLEWPKINLADEHRVDTARWAHLRKLRERVTEAIEPLRREKTIRSGLEAEVTVPASAVPEGFTTDDLATLFITGTVTLDDGDEVRVAKSDDAKCGRCWRLLPEVPEDGDLCNRCERVVEQMDGVS
ncbi:isoleucine--tRNA ligase [Aurantiacibacter poecillastricola]|uniref:isoleucine--tRNA ligase n=1 Tax=Aurantiacibacter poecillastricola TaxID=3064385 RepID=UPI00273EECDA|nr:isoleucine--tRNA ligase [Aurantiacibacter sp. 219JJ12-13]MDP5260430.1 isoleucine--tRNA ligase [Aurantiacibacter sp. 219JJ12-13]